MTFVTRCLGALLLVQVALLIAGPASAQKLVWSDEFNGAALDQSKWNYEVGAGTNGDWGTGQRDAATSRPENVRIVQEVAGADGGALAIVTRKETYQVPGVGTRQYTSGRINTAGKAAWGPGHQLRARVWPRDVRYEGQGFAFWAMPNETPPGQSHLSWPQGGEIDIMEYNGLFAYTNLGSVHYALRWANNGWQTDNHWHQGAYYSFETEQVPSDVPQWIQVDLGATREVTRVLLNWETAYARAYKVQISDDAETWTDLYSTLTGNGGTDNLTGLSGTGRYVRVYATQRGTQWGYSLWEFGAYGADGTNLALNRPASASSAENSTLDARAAVDGSMSTRWASGSLEAEMNTGAVDPNDPRAAVSGWHVYGIDWYEDHMDFVVDENVYHRHFFKDGGAASANGQDEKSIRTIAGRRVAYSEFSNHFEEWHPFEHEFYVILSSGVGGNGTYGGAIGPDAAFPASVFVDWVRVYEMSGTAAEAKAEYPSAFVLHDNYPNPFRAATTLSFSLPTPMPVRVDIFDLLGRKVLTRDLGFREAGQQEVRVDAADMSAGVYLYTVRAGTQSRTGQFTVIR